MILFTPRDSNISTCLLIRSAVVAISTVVNLVVPGDEIVLKVGVIALTMPKTAPVA